MLNTCATVSQPQSRRWTSWPSGADPLCNPLDQMLAALKFAFSSRTLSLGKASATLRVKNKISLPQIIMMCSMQGKIMIYQCQTWVHI